MRRRELATVVALAALSVGVSQAAATIGRWSKDPLCTGSYGGATPRPAVLRFGVDPGIAGSAGGVQLPSAPDDVAKDVAATSALRPPGRVLVARLNRLFWSDGDAGIARFKTLVGRYTRAGIDAELQVRYHPPVGEAGHLAAWRAWVRHVVDVFGSNPRVVAMTLTNEVNITFSPNTSDGAYAGARDALLEGIEAGHAEAVRRGYRQLRFGLTYAYRFAPSDDVAFFSYLGARGGASFRAALGFVGLDFYPGAIYPPATTTPEHYRADTAQALGTLRDCFLPMAAIGARVPIWITENGVETDAHITDAQQANALRELVHAARDYGRTFNVTDYRWFNLRDSRSGSTALFQTNGLVRSNYTRKPSFAAFRAAVAGLGERERTGPITRARCQSNCLGESG